MCSKLNHYAFRPSYQHICAPHTSVYCLHTQQILTCNKILILASKMAHSTSLQILYQRKLIKMRSELASLNHCAVPFLSRAAVNLCWYYIINTYIVYKNSLAM